MINTSEASKHTRKLRPFDSAEPDIFAMYQRLPYYRDTDLCTPEMITLVTGNVIKYFQYTVKDTFSLSGNDALALLKIKEYEEHEQERLSASHHGTSQMEIAATDEAAEIASSPADEVSPEQTSAEKQRPDYLDIDFE